ncbi:MAG: hypothetical protein Q9162_003057 [Coniocarpon cinnabarinum]
MDWQYFQNDQPSPMYDPHNPQLEYPTPFPPYPPPPPLPPPGFQDASMFAGYAPTSPTGPPPPPMWSGLFANGAPNPAVMTNFAPIGFNQVMSHQNFANASHSTNTAPNMQLNDGVAGNRSPRPGARKGQQKQKRATQNSRNHKNGASKAAGNVKTNNQDQRPSKKAKMSSSHQEQLQPLAGESLNQSMQRLGSIKATRKKQASQSQKANKGLETVQSREVDLQQPAKSTNNSVDQTHQLRMPPAVSTISIERERERMRHFLQTMHDHGFSFQDLLREGFDSQSLHELYSEIGVEIPSEEDEDMYEPDDVEDMVQVNEAEDDAYEPSDSLNPMFNIRTTERSRDNDGHLAVAKSAEASLQSAAPSNLAAAPNREDYLARLKALKEGHRVPSIQPDQLSALISPSQETPVSQIGPQDHHQAPPGLQSDAQNNIDVADSDEIARARAKAREAFRAARKAKAAVPSAPLVPPSYSAAPDEVDNDEVGTSHENGVPEVCPAYLTTDAPTSDAAKDFFVESAASDSVPEHVRLPGLFMGAAPKQTEGSSSSTGSAPLRDDSEPRQTQGTEVEGDEGEGFHEKVATSVEQDLPVRGDLGAADRDSARAEDFIEFTEGDDGSFSRYRPSLEPEIPGLTAISRRRPHSDSSNRPPLQHSSSYQDQIKGHQSRIDEMKRLIEQRESKKKAGRRTETPGTPQIGFAHPLSHRSEDVHESVRKGLQEATAVQEVQLPETNGPSRVSLGAIEKALPGFMSHHNADEPRIPSRQSQTRSSEKPAEAIEPSRSTESSAASTREHLEDDNLSPPGSHALSEPLNESQEKTVPKQSEFAVLRMDLQQEQREMGSTEDPTHGLAPLPHPPASELRVQPSLHSQNGQDALEAADINHERQGMVSDKAESELGSPSEAFGLQDVSNANETHPASGSHDPSSIDEDGDASMAGEDQVEGSEDNSPTSSTPAHAREGNVADEDDDLREAVMEMDSTSEGEISEDFEPEEVSLPQVPVIANRTPFMPIEEAREIQAEEESIREHDSQQYSENDSDEHSSTAMDLEGSDGTGEEAEEARDESSVGSAEEGEYLPEPVQTNDQTYVNPEQPAVSAQHSSSEFAPEDYEPPQPHASDLMRSQEEVGDDEEPEEGEEEEEEEEEDYEPPDLTGQVNFQTAPQPDHTFDDDQSDPDDLFDDAPEDNNYINNDAQDSASDVEEPYSPEIP